MTSDPDRFDLAEVDRLLTTTKQVRKRMDLERPVPRDLLLECIDIAQHAPMGGNLERNRWLVVDDPDLKAEIAPLYQQVGRPYLAANAAGELDAAQQRVIASATYLVDHIAQVPANRGDAAAGQRDHLLQRLEAGSLITPSRRVGAAGCGVP